jgi:hypothetical protein
VLSDEPDDLVVLRGLERVPRGYHPPLPLELGVVAAELVEEALQLQLRLVQRLARHRPALALEQAAGRVCRVLGTARDHPCVHRAAAQ